MQGHVRLQRTPDQIIVAVIVTETGDDVNFPAEGSYMIRGRKDTPREYLFVLIPRRDDVFLGRFAHRNHVLVFIDDGVADQHDTIVTDRLDGIEDRAEAAIVAQFAQMIADMRLEDVEVPVDQMGGTERNLIGKSDRSTAGFDRLALQGDLAGDVAVRIL